MTEAGLADSAARGRIHRLDPKLINQIAAGEVIVRPASAVKELIENSFDAGATRIEIDVEEDARSFTIRDDGCGMTPEDAALSVERHATSKIQEFDDLSDLRTRGFRGEALAAIVSVSRFELITRRRGDRVGTHLRAFGGGEPAISETGAPEGCLIRVRDLFYNTPARMKFLKGPMVEWGHILREITRQSLTRPDVGFQIRWRGRPYLSLAGGQTLAERFAAVLPSEAGKDLIEIDAELSGARAWGVISSPRNTRRDRRHQYFFANGRPIVSRTLTFALQEAYRGMIMTQRFPVAAVFVEIPAGQLDVNVHPAKEEVRFLNESLAAGVIHRAALVALKKTELTPTISLGTPGRKYESPARGMERGRAPQDMVGARVEPGVRADSDSKDDVPFLGTGDATIDIPAGRSGPVAQADLLGLSAGAAYAREEHEEVIDVAYTARGPAESSLEPRGPRGTEDDPSAAADATLIDRLRREGVRPRAVAQIGLTYILADAAQHGLLMIDQHAAHEKLLYLKFRARPDRRAVQELLAPYTYEAGPSERPWMELVAPLLTAEGFETEPFGGSTFIVRSVPLVFEGMDVEAFLRDLIGEARGESRRELDRALEKLRVRIGAMAACRAAIKAGDPLNAHEMQAIVDQTLSVTEAMRCPHGRPTLLLLTKDQLDRQFGRLG